MGDVGDLFNELKVVGKGKREKNRNLLKMCEVNDET